jgi:hypothetical protein
MHALVYVWRPKLDRVVARAFVSRKPQAREMCLRE